MDAGIPNPAEKDQVEKMDRNFEEGIRLEITKVRGTLKKMYQAYVIYWVVLVP